MLFTRAKKLEMRAPWRNTLVVKLVGRALGYTYFAQEPREPREFYCPSALRKASNKIGPLSRIDGYTADGGRAQYARLYIGH